jgi:glutamate racemase
MSDSRPIGVFDSGLGGLTVVREIFRMMPTERVLYLGDTARLPYGNRSDETISRFGVEDGLFLASHDIKMLIVACNTVSSVALDEVRKRVPDIPVIGVVQPGERAAVLRTAEKKVGVVGTHATIRTGAYAKAIAEIDPNVKVFSRPCPLFVPLVEEGMADTDITRLVAERYIYELVDSGMDCLILGCTHYPLLLEVLQGTAGNHTELIDSALWTAKGAHDILVALNSMAPKGTDGRAKSTFVVTDVTPHFERQAEWFLGGALPSFEAIQLEDLVKHRTE